MGIINSLEDLAKVIELAKSNGLGKLVIGDITIEPLYSEPMDVDVTRKDDVPLERDKPKSVSEAVVGEIDPMESELFA